MRFLILVLSPFLIGCLGLYAFLHLSTAILFFAGFGVFTYGVMRFWEHHHGEGSDSRLSDERMRQARDWWIEEVKGRN